MDDEQIEPCGAVHRFQSVSGFISEVTCTLPQGHDGQHHDDDSGADWD